MRRHAVGLLNGAVAAASYGTNPLFALPLYAGGIGVNSVLFYRYAFAVLIYGFWLKFVKKIPLGISKKEFFPLLILGLFFSLSSLTLFQAFQYIEAGIACTILFIYPVLVAVIMAAFFKEKLTGKVVVAILLTSCGIGLLYNGKPGSTLNLHGVAIVFLSALLYALYIVGVKKIKIIQHRFHKNSDFGSIRTVDRNIYRCNVFQRTFDNENCYRGFNDIKRSFDDYNAKEIRKIT